MLYLGMGSKAFKGEGYSHDHSDIKRKTNGLAEWLKW
jgi:hypothetical protein